VSTAASPSIASVTSESSVACARLICKRLTPDAMPHRVLLVGIEGRCFDLVGHPPTPEVAAAIGPATDEVIRCLHQLGGGDFPGAQTSRPQAEQRTPSTGKAQGAP